MLLPILLFSKNYKIGEWNGLRLGDGNKDIESFADVIFTGNFDIIGIVEVMNEYGLKSTVMKLNIISKVKYDYIISEKSVGSSKYKEYYGFIYKKIPDIQIKSKLGFYKEIKSTDFMREPYCVTFKIGKVTFNYVLLHVQFANDDKKIIRNEISKVPDVITYFQKNKFMTFVTGDFNLQPTDKGFVLYDYKTLIPVILKTTIGNNKLDNCYDNFVIDKNIFFLEYNVYDYTRIFKDKTFKEDRTTISDHLPTYVIINDNIKY
jgi:hypothetical protein